MAVPLNRLSTTFVDAEILAPDNKVRTLDEDFELGPVALNDPSEGLRYQEWHLTWAFAGGDFTVTPADVGAPAVVLNAAAVTQCSLAFDNNGHVTIAFTSNNQAKLYWYDTVAAGWVTTTLAAGNTSPHLTLDDKRPSQTSNNDILLFYTRQQLDDSWNLYHRFQRERFLNEYLYATGVQPYIYRCGMHDGLRIKIGFSDVIL